MKKRFKMILGTTVLSLSLLASAVPGFAFDAEQNASGGWSESRGYYVNSPSGISTFSTTTPDEHHGERLSNGDPTAPAYAAYGYTLWSGKYHYTTARMELSNGTVKTTSGRQWDWNGTTATSPYYAPSLFENPEARTYWGY